MIRLTDFVEKAARSWPERPAVTTTEGSSLTWAQLWARIRALARVLHHAGIRPGDRVAWLGFNGIPAVECYYAPALIGAIAVPLNFRLSMPELHGVAEDCRPRILISDPAHQEAAIALRETCPFIERVFVTGDQPSALGCEGYEAALADPGPEVDFAPLTSGDSDPLILFYTSGTTGRPKGVMISHANLYANAMGTAYHFGLAGGRTHFVTGPMFHTAPGARIFAAPLFGTHLVLIPQFDIPTLLAAIEHHRVELLQFVPTMMAMLLEHPDLHRHDLSSLRDLTYGAAPISVALLRRALAAFPGARFWQAFGMTEAAPIVTVLTAAEHVTEGQGVARLASIGRPVAYCDLRILDPQGRDVPRGSTGEIVVRGPNIMQGYWNRPDETAAVLRDGWYHTGDGGYQDDEGYVFLAGRIKDMIITGGENVYPIEVEDVLAHHPAVASCAVIGVPDATWGERVLGVVCLRPGATASDKELIDWARARLAHYKCPSRIAFLGGDMPLTTVGKIDKQTLRARFAKETP